MHSASGHRARSSFIRRLNRATIVFLLFAAAVILFDVRIKPQPTKPGAPEGRPALSLAPAAPACTQPPPVYWYASPPIGCNADGSDTTVEILKPSWSGSDYCLAGQKVHFTCQRSFDLDTRVQGGSYSYQYDALDPFYPEWMSSAGGYFVGPRFGTSVYWVANAEGGAGSNANIFLYEKDVADGAREDGKKLVCTAYINIAKPNLTSVSFTDDQQMYYNSSNHEGWGVGGEIQDPVMVITDSGVTKDDPACYTMGSWPRVWPTTNASGVGSVTFMEPVPMAHIKAFGFLGNSEFNFQDCCLLDVSGLPFPSTNHQSMASLPLGINRFHLGPLTWKYMVPFPGAGDGQWRMFAITHHTLYTVFDAPRVEFTIKRGDKLWSEWAGGATLPHLAGNGIQAGVNGGDPPYDNGNVVFRGDPWFMMEDTDSPHWNEGDCISQAGLIATALQTLGCDAMPVEVHASSDSITALDSGGWRICWNHDFPRLEYLLLVFDEVTQNYEGTCQLYDNGMYYMYAGMSPPWKGHGPTPDNASIDYLRDILHYNTYLYKQGWVDHHEVCEWVPCP